MLTSQTARESINSGCFIRSQISSPEFVCPAYIWKKSKSSKCHIQKSQVFSTPHKIAFAKYGKTFGIETTRYLEYRDGKIFYFDDENDKEWKGLCEIDNLYMDYTTSGNKHAMHLSNGFESTTFYFPNLNSFKSIEEKICKQVVQINFKQKYTISNLLGEGTFSKVYLAKPNAKMGKFAVKIVPKIDSTGFSTKHIIQEERKILRHLNDDLICKMEEFFEDNNNYIIVLEYLTGKDLNCILKESHQLSLNEIKFILKQTLYSLSYIHKMNIIHRDLKPHNIIVDLEKKKVKLIDFGLSLMYSTNTNIDKFMRCGTMGYIAPEVVNNSDSGRKRYDTKSDMFGFGIIAHMLLMGRNPLRGKTYKETIDKNVLGEVQIDKVEVESKYGEACYNMLKGLLEKECKHRLSADETLQSSFLNQSSFDDATMIKSEIKDDFEAHNKETNYVSEKENKENKNLNMTKLLLEKSGKNKLNPENTNFYSTKFGSSSRSNHKFGGIH